MQIQIDSIDNLIESRSLTVRKWQLFEINNPGGGSWNKIHYWSYSTKNLICDVYPFKSSSGRSTACPSAHSSRGRCIRIRATSLHVTFNRQTFMIRVRLFHTIYNTSHLKFHRIPDPLSVPSLSKNPDVVPHNSVASKFTTTPSCCKFAVPVARLWNKL